MHEQIQNLLQGANTVELSMATLSAGVYYVKFMVDGESWYKKMIKE